jgi:hypothetical protein
MKRKLLVYGGFVLTTTLISVVLVYANGPMTADQELARRMLLMPGHIIWGLICLPVVHGAEVCSFKALAATMNVVGYCGSPWW